MRRKKVSIAFRFEMCAFCFVWIFLPLYWTTVVGNDNLFNKDRFNLSTNDRRFPNKWSLSTKQTKWCPHIVLFSNFFLWNFDFDKRLRRILQCCVFFGGGKKNALVYSLPANERSEAISKKSLGYAWNFIIACYVILMFSENDNCVVPHWNDIGLCGQKTNLFIMLFCANVRACMRHCVRERVCVTVCARDRQHDIFS